MIKMSKIVHSDISIMAKDLKALPYSILKPSYPNHKGILDEWFYKPIMEQYKHFKSDKEHNRQCTKCNLVTPQKVRFTFEGKMTNYRYSIFTSLV
jgi:hypothetical protein